MSGKIPSIESKDTDFSGSENERDEQEVNGLDSAPSSGTDSADLLNPTENLDPCHTPSTKRKLPTSTTQVQNKKHRSESTEPATCDGDKDSCHSSESGEDEHEDFAVSESDQRRFLESIEAAERGSVLSPIKVREIAQSSSTAAAQAPAKPSLFETSADPTPPSAT